MYETNEFGQIVEVAFENWQPKQHPPHTEMVGNYCILAPLNITQHSLKLYEVLLLDNKGESWTYLPYGPFATYEEFHQWLIEVNSNKNVLFYVILDPKNENPVGMCSYLRIKPEYGVIEVGHIHYAKMLQKTIAATEAMFLMMQRVFDELHYRRYEWKCNVLNKASIFAAERLGFSYEGVFKQHMVYKNRSRDTAWFSIVDTEWPAIKNRLQKWLAKDNFDKNGKQISRLKEIEYC